MATQTVEKAEDREVREDRKATEESNNENNSTLYRVIILYPGGEKAVRWYKDAVPIIDKAGNLISMSMGYIENVVVQKIESRYSFSNSLIYALNGEEHKWIKNIESIAVFGKKQDPVPAPV